VSATDPNVARSLVRSGAIIMAGLAIEAISFGWNHPISFLLFSFAGVTLVLAGVAHYLWSIARA